MRHIFIVDHRPHYDKSWAITSAQTAPSELAPGAVRAVRGDNFVPCNQPVERLIAGGTSFALKGSGWAKDGYR